MNTKTALYTLLLLALLILASSSAIAQCSVLGVSPGSLSFSSSSGTKSINVQTSPDGCTDYSVSQVGTFFTVYKSTWGISVTCNENTTFYSRTGRVVIADTYYVQISQGPACPPQDPPGDITGFSAVCPNTTASYLTSYVEGVTSYYWTVTNGGTVEDGQGTGKAIIRFASSNATVSVQARNYCQNLSTPKTFSVSVVSDASTIPGQPGTISASSTTVCETKTLNFSIAAVPRAEEYVWSGGYVVSGDGTTNVTMRFNNPGSTNVSVVAKNPCGSSSPSTIPITVGAIPLAPTGITAKDGTNGLCIGSNQTFLVSPIDSNPDVDYVWEVQGTNWTFVNGKNTGAGVQLTIGTGTATLKVKATTEFGCETTPFTKDFTSVGYAPIHEVFGNGLICPGLSTTVRLDGSESNYMYNVLEDGVIKETKNGTGAGISFEVTPPTDREPVYTIQAQDPAGACPVPMNGSVTIDFKPAAPSQPGFINGAFHTVCNGSSALFSIEPVERATNYTWSGGTVIAGQNEAQAEIRLSPISNSARILVTASNECGTSLASTRLIPVTKVTPPVFQSPYPTQCAGGEYTYSVEWKPGYSYNWEAPYTWAVIGGQGEAYARLKVGRYDGAVNVRAIFNGCSSEPASLSMDIREPGELYAVYGSDVICHGESSTISLSGSLTGYDYTLKRGEETIMTQAGTGQSLTFGSFADAGTYKVYSNLAGQCFYPMDGEAIITVETPSSAPTSITASAYETCINSPIILSVFGGTLGHGASWKWYSGACSGQPIATGSSISVAPSLNTTYYVSAEGNCNTTTCASVTITTISNCPDRSLQTYLRTRTPQKSGYTTLPVNASVADINDQYQYLDALGRSSQLLDVKASPTGNDVLSINKYDRFGREDKKYLPASVANNNGMITASPESIIANFYNATHVDHPENVADTEAPFSKTIFESSPLNRVLKQGAAGTPWQPGEDNYSLADHTIKHRVRSNVSGEVLMWTYDKVANVIQANNGTEFRYYEPNSLIVNQTYDEHNNLVLEYIDKHGRVVLKRVQATSNQNTLNNTNFASTYYVYDDFGNLVVVLPPEALKTITE